MVIKVFKFSIINDENNKITYIFHREWTGWSSRVNIKNLFVKLLKNKINYYFIKLTINFENNKLPTILPEPKIQIDKLWWETAWINSWALISYYGKNSRSLNYGMWC